MHPPAGAGRGGVRRYGGIAIETAIASERASLLRFVVPSTLGAAFFLLPVPNDGIITVPMGLLSDWIREQFAPVLPALVVSLCVFSALATLAYLKVRPNSPQSTAEKLLRPGIVWTLLRVAGAVSALAIFFQIGPEWIWGENTGNVVLNDLYVPGLVTIGIACLVLPFITEFGLMDYVGVLVQRPFRALFRVPGRSAIDATASWLGGSSVGVIVTAQQYESGQYSAREAAIIATNFSIVSIAFCYVIVDVLRLEAYFLPFYGVLTLTGIICAVIMARIPPLSRKPDTYLVEGQALDTPIGEGSSRSRALDAALQKASSAPPSSKMAKGVAINILDIWLGLIPAGIFIALVAVVLAEYTPIFTIISQPFVPLLSTLSVESPVEAAPSMVIGFAEMFLPALTAADIPSIATRFVVAVVSVGQLIFMSEVGILMLKSSLPLNLLDLVVIFLLRTLILLPMAVIAAAIIF